MLRSKTLWIALPLVLIPTTAFATPPTKPGTPFGRTTADSVSFSWTASSDNVGVAGYNVYANNNYLATVSDASFTGTLDAGQVYRFYVIAFDTPADNEARQFSQRSDTLTLQTQIITDNPIPTAPEMVLAIRLNDTSASIRWSASADDEAVAGYNVYRNNNYLTTVSQTEFTDNAINASDTYRYYIVAFDAPRNFSVKSAEVELESAPIVEGPDTTAPETTRGLVATAVTPETVTLNWETPVDNVGVDGYNVYRDGSYIDTVFAASYADANYPENDTASYQIVAFDAARNFSGLSDALTVDLPAPTGTPPTLRDPLAEPIPSPDFNDPFGSLFEIDTEEPTAGGPPTQPKFLRAELISNDWAEMNWAPSNDDVEVVEYRIYRSDGVTYTVNNTTTSDNGGTQNELDRFWRSTLFIDCNYTRFSDQIYICDTNGPEPGDVFTYQVSAVDNEGQESVLSEALEVVYHLQENAPIPYYNDFYKENDDRFVQEHDLSRVRYFIEDFVPVFEDNFEGTEINSQYWNTGLTWGDTRIINGEQQYFVNSQLQPDFGYNPFTFTGESLIIEAIPTREELRQKLPPICNEPDPLGFERCEFLSGALSSHDKFGLTYGYVESRMKVSGAYGALSSFYLYNRYPGLGRQLHAPEIDIVEYLGENPFGDEDAFQTYHYANVNDGTTNSAPTMNHVNPEGTLYAEDFHTFGVLWEPQLVIWYIDGIEVKRMTGPQVARQQMNIVTYLVAGSSWAPTPILGESFPMQYEIDYIKAYQRPPFNTNGLYPDK